MQLILTNIHWKDWCWSWNSNTSATWCEELTHWKRAWCWERLKAGEEGGNRGWDGWMASPTRWTWVWASSKSWWWIGKPGMLQSMGSQRIGHSWTELILLKAIGRGDQNNNETWSFNDNLLCMPSLFLSVALEERNLTYCFIDVKLKLWHNQVTCLRSYS